MTELAAVPMNANVPPQNLEAEESVLGAMMIAPAAIQAVSDILDAGHFYRESHAKIYRAALALNAKGEPVDAITLTDILEERGELDDVGGRVRIHELAKIVPASANASHYARIVKEAATLRAFIRAGGELARLGWDRPAEIDELRERARALFTELDGGTTTTSTVELETWTQFERSATEHVPTLVDGLWPAGGLGFIAAPPKKGKTWVGLDLAVSVAAGVPFLNQFPVTDPQPVVYVALEGHRAAIRGRIGVLARGHGLDPDPGSHDLRNLHVLYKPRGLNLSDPAWVRTIRDTVQAVGAKLVLVDVLRRAATMKENSNDEWAELLLKLQPLQDNDCSIALLHHFGKLTELSKERSPGERMSGAGAMYGAFDVGIFITRSDEGARKLRVEFETRDLASPEPIGVHLTGNPTGTNGGFIYRDTATWETEEAPDEADQTANAAEVATWLELQPGREATQQELAYAFEVDPRTIVRRRHSYERHGIQWEPARGQKPIRYWLPEAQIDLQAAQRVSGHAEWTTMVDTVHPEQLSTLETPDLQGKPDETDLGGQGWTNNAVHLEKTPDLQGSSRVDRVDSPTESTNAVAVLTDDEIEALAQVQAETDQ